MNTTSKTTSIKKIPRMIEGVLWVNKDPVMVFKERVRMIANSYEKRFGVRPTICLVNPKSLPGEVEAVDDIRIYPAKYVQKNNYWVGRDAKE